MEIYRFSYYICMGFVHIDLIALFIVLGNSNVASKLRLYSQVCRSFLGKLTNWLISSFLFYAIAIHKEVWDVYEMELIFKLYSLQHHYWPSKIWTSRCLNQHPITDQGTNQPRQNQISTSRITIHSPCQLRRLTWRKTKVNTHQWHIFMIFVMIWICISSKVFFFFMKTKVEI